MAAKRYFGRKDIRWILTPSDDDVPGGVYDPRSRGYALTTRLQNILRDIDHEFWETEDDDATLAEEARSHSFTLSGQADLAIDDIAPVAVSGGLEHARSVDFVPGRVTQRSFYDQVGRANTYELDKRLRRFQNDHPHDYRKHLRRKWLAIATLHTDELLLKFNTDVGVDLSAKATASATAAGIDAQWVSETSLRLTGLTNVPFAFSGYRIGKRGLKL